MLYKFISILILFSLIISFGCKKHIHQKPNKIVIEKSEFISDDGHVTYFLPFYEDINEYSSFDFFRKNFSGNESVQYQYIEDGVIRIINTRDLEFNDWMEIKFEINKDLEVANATYNYRGDIEIGTNYVVDDIILILNKSPFEGIENLIGRYTLKLINRIRLPGAEKDSVYYTIFRGKFKFYNEKEKEMGLDWVKSQNEIKAGIKDSNNVYNDYAVDEPAKMEFDKIIFPDFDRPSVLLDEKPVTRYATFIVDENGIVIKESIQFEEQFSKIESEKIKQQIIALGKWEPAIHKCKAVKSKVRLPFKTNPGQAR